MYHSTFTYENVSLDLHDRPLVDLDDNNNDETASATKKTLLDFFAERKSDPQLIQAMEDNKIDSFLAFAKYFTINKNKINPRKNPEMIIIITSPQVTYNIKDPKKYAKYCFYQFIKYGGWDSSSIKDLNFENSITTWNSFIITAPDEIKQSVE